MRAALAAARNEAFSFLRELMYALLTLPASTAGRLFNSTNHRFGAALNSLVGAVATCAAAAVTKMKRTMTAQKARSTRPDHRELLMTLPPMYGENGIAGSWVRLLEGRALSS